MKKASGVIAQGLRDCMRAGVFLRPKELFFQHRYQFSILLSEKAYSMPSPYQDLLTALAREVGLDPTSLVATEAVVINELTICLHLAGEGVNAEVLLCSLLAVPSADRWREVAHALLLANHLWTGTGGAILGMLPEDNMVTLSVRQPLRDLDAEKLAVLLATTANIGLAWQDFIAAPQSTAGSNEPFSTMDALRA